MPRKPSHDPLAFETLTLFSPNQYIQKVIRLLLPKTIGGKPRDMLFDPEIRLYYKQYDLEYDVRDNGDTVHKADRMKLNLFFDPFRRVAEQTDLEVAVEMQRRSLQSILDAG